MTDRWENNIKTGHQETVCGSAMDWTGSLWSPMAKYCKHDNEPLCSL